MIQNSGRLAMSTERISWSQKKTKKKNLLKKIMRPTLGTQGRNNMLTRVMRSLAPAIEQLEAATVKKVSFIYSHHSFDGSSSVSIKVYQNIISRKSLYTSRFLESTASDEEIEKWVSDVLMNLGNLRSLPDAPIEKEVTVRMPESKARELGLEIA